MFAILPLGAIVGYVVVRLLINNHNWNSEFGLINARRKNPIAFIAGLNTEK